MTILHHVNRLFTTRYFSQYRTMLPGNLRLISARGINKLHTCDCERVCAMHFATNRETRLSLCSTADDLIKH